MPKGIVANISDTSIDRIIIISIIIITVLIIISDAGESNATRSIDQ